MKDLRKLLVYEALGMLLKSKVDFFETLREPDLEPDRKLTQCEEIVLDEIRMILFLREEIKET